MHCDNEMCVYNDEENGCMLEEIEINSIGMCSGYTLLTLDEEKREEIRSEMLKSFAEFDDEI